MNRMCKSLGALTALTFAVTAVSAPAQGAPDMGAPGQDLSLKPVAGRFVGGDFKPVGNGTAAQAQWTNKLAHTGKFSVLMEKSVPTSEPAFAAAIVDGVEGWTVADLGSIGFWVDGPCTGGSPRFNLGYDTDGDGDRDGTAFYGCANHVTATDGDWTQMSVATATVSDSGPVPATATVLSLSVLVDEQGTYAVDDVTVAGQTVGEPND